MKSLDVTLRLPPPMRLPVPESAEAAVEREEMVAWQGHADGTVSFLSVVAGDLAVVRAAVADLDPVQSVEFAPIDDDTFYLYAEMETTPADVALWETFEERRLVVVPPVVYLDTDVVRLTVLGDPDALRGVVADLPDEVGVEVDRLSDHRHPATSLAGRLTNRQFEAVRTARELGYYEVPREASLAAVADALDCSESAASTLLRKGERALVDAAFPG
ncbi:helix-turn-helix domain-containing protein [Halobium salinum]|uniref:Helix-turn-helix domain-containing protein n=1 Tax=Halobium salinum TaxID=1364940 RepID=A0ABD5PEP3_9EURY|nr:helix-turn-helix domain-containing protein [Halobium salinum]